MNKSFTRTLGGTCIFSSLESSLSSSFCSRTLILSSISFCCLSSVSRILLNAKIINPKNKYISTYFVHVWMMIMCYLHLSSLPVHQFLSKFLCSVVWILHISNMCNLVVLWYIVTPKNLVGYITACICYWEQKISSFYSHKSKSMYTFIV